MKLECWHDGRCVWIDRPALFRAMVKPTKYLSAVVGLDRALWLAMRVGGLHWAGRWPNITTEPQE